MGFCDGEIKGNPDIAGTGIVSAMFVNSGISFILSTILWVYVFSRGQNRFELSDTHHWTIAALRDVLVMQGDSQLISGLSIMIASLVNMCKDDDTPLYHIFVARSLADVSLSGHLATITLVPRTEHNWTIRILLIVVCIFLWWGWSFLAFFRFESWDWETPHCLENDNIFRGDYVGWIYLSCYWVPLGYVPIFLNQFKLSEIVDHFENQITKFPNAVFKRFRQIPSSFSISEILRDIAFAVASGLLCLLYLIFAVLGPSSRTLLPLQMLVFMSWNAYDVAKARGANAHIVVDSPQYRSHMSFQNNPNPEHDWGFGQILPHVMLLLPFLTALDFVQSRDTPSFGTELRS